MESFEAEPEVWFACDVGIQRGRVLVGDYSKTSGTRKL